MTVKHGVGRNVSMQHKQTSINNSCTCDIHPMALWTTVLFQCKSSYLRKMLSLYGNAFSEFQHLDKAIVYPVNLSIIPFPKLAMTNEGGS